MTEHYEDIIHNGRVVGRVLVSGGVIEPPPRKRWVTEREFRLRRLSEGEGDRIEIAMFKGIRPHATTQDIAIAAKLQRLQRILAGGVDNVVDLDNPDLRSGLQALATLPGLLDPAPVDPQYPSRVAEILDAPIAEYHPLA